jgi:hypothetical protein
VPKPPVGSADDEAPEPKTPAEADDDPSAAGDEPPVEALPSSAGAGDLDRATVKRSWVAVVAEVRKRKPSRAMLFSNVEVDIDADDSSLVIEFPEDMRYTMRQAADPDTREMLRASLVAVFGAAPAFRYQLGRGAVRSAEDAGEAEILAELDEPAEPQDAEASEVSTPTPDPAEGDETTPADPGEEDIETLLMAELGAEKIAEHPHETDE